CRRYELIDPFAADAVLDADDVQSFAAEPGRVHDRQGNRTQRPAHPGDAMEGLANLLGRRAVAIGEGKKVVALGPRHRERHRPRQLLDVTARLVSVRATGIDEEAAVEEARKARVIAFLGFAEDNGGTDDP